MLISIEELKKRGDYSKYTDDQLKDKLDGLESLIRAYTNNNFQNRNIRVYCASENNVLKFNSPYFKVGDTIQISNSKYNDGLYVIQSIDSNGVSLDGSIYNVEKQTVTKIEYPKAVINTAIGLLDWEKQFGDKRGIQSESIGRHSVTYFSQDKSNSFGGYPLSLFNSLNEFQKARF